MKVKIGTIVRHKDSKDVFIVVDNVKIINEDNTWNYGVLYSSIDGTALLVRTKKDFIKTFKVIKE